MKGFLQKLLQKEGVKYLIAGGCTTVFNLVVFVLLHWALQMEVNLSNFLSVVLSILFAYFINKLYVFRSHCNSMKELGLEFVKFVGARVGTMVIEVGGVWLLHTVLTYHELISKLITMVVVLIVNYIISKLLVFRRKRGE